jgi:hypothetical protein
MHYNITAAKCKMQNAKCRDIRESDQPASSTYTSALG